MTRCGAPIPLAFFSSRRMYLYSMMLAKRNSSLIVKLALWSIRVVMTAVAPAQIAPYAPLLCANHSSWTGFGGALPALRVLSATKSARICELMAVRATKLMEKGATSTAH